MSQFMLHWLDETKIVLTYSPPNARTIETVILVLGGSARFFNKIMGITARNH